MIAEFEERQGGAEPKSRPGTVVTATATRTRGLYLGRYATVMDAVMLAWEGGANTVALDRQGAITRTARLEHTGSRKRYRRCQNGVPES